MTIKEKWRQDEYIAKANEVEKKYNIPENLLVGLLKTESGLNPKAVSSVGAKGIAQFMPGTAKEFGIDPYNTDQAIEAAGKYLYQNYKKLGNWEDTLRSYNMGLSGVQKWKEGKRALPKETQDYVGKVYKNMGVNSIPNTESINIEVSNLHNPIQSGNFASVPDMYVEPKEEVKVVEVEKQQPKENPLMQRYQDSMQQSVAPQYEEEQYVLPELTDVLGMFSNVSSFVDNPIAKKGGTIPVSSNGMYEYPNQEVIVPTNGSITMKGIPHKILGISKETGEKKLMSPNLEYFFKNTKNVLEIPVK